MNKSPPSLVEVQTYYEQNVLKHLHKQQKCGCD